MNFRRYVAVASLVVSGLAAAGCADISDESADVGGSEDELKADAQKFVGDYSWTPDLKFADFKDLSLKADGAYTADVQAILVKNIKCVAFPCTLPEAGKWTTTTDKKTGKLKLKLTPNNNRSPRTYFASLAKNELSLTRYNETSTLRKVEPAPNQNEPCVVSGCSSEICADEEMFSPCIFKPEFACYKKTACERQADGQCGWTMTPAVKACLANP